MRFWLQGLFAVGFTAIVLMLLIAPSRNGRDNAPHETHETHGPFPVTSGSGSVRNSERPADGAAKAKIVTMAEAVSLVELVAKGQVLKAERKDKPSPYFKFDVQTMQGGKEKWEVDIHGQVRKIAEKRDDR